MTLRYSSSDSYTNTHNNHWWTATHLIDSIKNPNNTLSADNSSLRLPASYSSGTIATALTAFLKATHNKVKQLLSRFTVSQAQTAVQNIGRQILLYFSSRFLSAPEICTSRIKACVKSTYGRSKTRAKKFYYGTKF